MFIAFIRIYKLYWCFHVDFKQANANWSNLFLKAQSLRRSLAPESLLRMMKMLFYLFIQVLRILTKNVQSPGTISFRVSGNQPAKICQKSIRYGNINFEYYSIERLRANFCSLIKHA